MSHILDSWLQKNSQINLGNSFSFISKRCQGVEIIKLTPKPISEKGILDSTHPP